MVAEMICHHDCLWLLEWFYLMLVKQLLQLFPCVTMSNGNLEASTVPTLSAMMRLQNSLLEVLVPFQRCHHHHYNYHLMAVVVDPSLVGEV